jgi:hypothetical protein
MAEPPSSPRPPSEEGQETSVSKRRSTITLIDHTKPEETDTEQEEQTMQPVESAQTQPDGSPASKHHSHSDSPHRSAMETLRQQRSRHKYNRFGADRINSETPTSPNQPGARSSWGQGHLERGYRHIHDSLRHKNRNSKALREEDDTSELDVLYENERGLFLLGTPFFSGNALGPWDPGSWTDGEFKKSRVNIMNAQVPDPSWEWAWKTWYVDMGGDVDEEGWEYSFYFRRFAWHGNHPWFHSFVRRRRWIRKRVRKQQVPKSSQSMVDPHMMNQDYFTIHSGHIKGLNSGLTSPLTEQATPVIDVNGKTWGVDVQEAWEVDKVEDIGALIKALRDAPVDSERIAVIKNFLENGGDDVYYLAEEVRIIFGLALLMIE